MPGSHPAEETIAAIATPLGQAGIGIIRISGTRAKEIALKIFRPRRSAEPMKSHRLYLGDLIDPSSGLIIDEVLLSYTKAPRSYTREDVVEINSHSGYLLLSKILHIVLREGARPARPGEFTLRAFLNGRIDLTQAEAVVDLINARSEKGLHLASQQIRGAFREQIEHMAGTCLDLLARIEVAIDFPEEAEEILHDGYGTERIARELLEPIERAVEAYSQRRIWMDGIPTVIVGRVNAGKSSLLNRLLNEERAIVTPVPGTTRDVIESTLHIQGIPLQLMDTAGFREVKSEVERIGLLRTEQRLAEAELSLIVIDRSRSLCQDDLGILERCRDKKALVLINKIDLPSRLDEEALRTASHDLPAVRISALTGEGLDRLQQAIVELVLGSGTTSADLVVAPSLRHKMALEEAHKAFERASQGVVQGLPMEIIADDLQQGLGSLGEIVGETTSEDVIEKIFSRFCIGK